MSIPSLAEPPSHASLPKMSTALFYGLIYNRCRLGFVDLRRLLPTLIIESGLTIARISRDSAECIKLYIILHPPSFHLSVTSKSKHKTHKT